VASIGELCVGIHSLVQPRPFPRLRSSVVRCRTPQPRTSMRITIEVNFAAPIEELHGGQRQHQGL
jgi:hypothetical protein